MTIRGRGTLLSASICVLLLPTLFAGCAARQTGRVETAVVQKVKQNVMVHGNADANPLPATRENIDAGRENFSHYCMICHRLDGQNTDVPFADRMSPSVPLLNSPAVQNYADGQLKWVIDHGIFPSGMPASSGILNDDEIWQIVHYLRHLPPRGSLGKPGVYAGDASEIGGQRKLSGTFDE